jgi:excisionase family DNA binding protein
MDTNIIKNKTSQLEGLLSPADVASLLQVSVATIHAWRHYGKPCPPAIQIGGLLRFRSEDLQQWINEQSVSKGAI